jgi:hypothetical protein
MVATGITLIIVALVLAIIGISFIYDISKNVGPSLGGGTVDSNNPNRIYTFFRIRGKGVAVFVTVLVFLLALGSLGGGIAVFAVA